MTGGGGSLGEPPAGGCAPTVPNAARPAASAPAASTKYRLRTAGFPHRLIDPSPGIAPTRVSPLPIADGWPLYPPAGGGYLISFFAIFAVTASLRSMPVCSLRRNR